MKVRYATPIIIVLKISPTELFCGSPASGCNESIVYEVWTV